MISKQFVQWQGDLEEVAKQLTWMYLQQETWKRLDHLISESPWPRMPVYFWDYIYRSHWASMAMALRRQVDPDPRSISLYRCVEQVASRDIRVTRAHYLGLWEAGHSGHEHWQSVAERDWERLAGTGEKEYPACRAFRHLKGLERRSRRVKRFVNKVFAHHNRSDVDTVDLRQLDQLRRLLVRLHIHYHLLAHAATCMTDSLVGINELLSFKELSVPWNLEMAYDCHWACGLPQPGESRWDRERWATRLKGD